jgi:hypothetical protein
VIANTTSLGNWCHHLIYSNLGIFYRLSYDYYGSKDGIVYGMATRGSTTKAVAVLEYWKLLTAVALTARRQASTATGSVLWSPVLRAQVRKAPAMEKIPVGGGLWRWLRRGDLRVGQSKCRRLKC